MAAIYNDGNVPYGSRVFTFATGGAMVAESFSVEQPTKVITVENESGEPIKQVIIADFETATATVQLPSGGAVPVLGDLGLSGYVVTSVSLPEEQGGIKKATVQFRKLYD